MTYLLGIFRPTKLLFCMGALGVGLCVVAVFAQNMIGLLAVVSISLSFSLMFPTIYGVALRGLGQDTKFGAAGLVMAILGGALAAAGHGLGDGPGRRGVRASSYPGVCLAFVGELRALRPAQGAGGRRTCGRGRSLTWAHGPPDRPFGRRRRPSAWASPRLRRRRGGGHTSASSPSRREEPVLGQDAGDRERKTAGDNNVDLLTATGTSDVDSDSQVAALGGHDPAPGAKGILIAPAPSEAARAGDRGGPRGRRHRDREWTRRRQPGARPWTRCSRPTTPRPAS